MGTNYTVKILLPEINDIPKYSAIKLPKQKYYWNI